MSSVPGAVLIGAQSSRLPRRPYEKFIASEDACAPVPWSLPLPALTAEPFDRVFQNADAAIELIDGNKFSGAMSDADIARAKDDCFRAERHHARRFSPEGDRAGR